jgi:hypothetical protein
MIVEANGGTFCVTGATEPWFTVVEPVTIGTQVIPAYTWFATDGVSKVGWGLFKLHPENKQAATELILRLANELTLEQKRELRRETLETTIKVQKRSQTKLEKKIAKMQAELAEVSNSLIRCERELEGLTAR